MLVVQNTENFRIESPTIVTIGTFDGVHLGHQKILGRLAELKAETGLQTAVLTFEPHPRKVLFPDQKDLRLLTMIEEKLELLQKNGVDVAVVYPFTAAFSELDAETYVRDILHKQMKVSRLVIGYDHRFGKGRTGNIDVLRQFAGTYQFEVEEISARDIDNIAISSTKIRKALEEGQVELAAEYLGHPYSISSTVVQGKQLGRTLGYPTANLQQSPPDKLIPDRGVYLAAVRVNNQDYYGMMSVGYNPTTDQDHKIKTEVHIFDFNQDIYGKDITVSFLKRLRDEKKFAGLDDLKNQLHHDREMCLAIISETEA